MVLVVLSTVVGRWDRRRLLWLSLALFVVGTIVTAVAPDFAALTAARVLGALGASLFTPTAVVIAAGLVPLDRRGRAVSTALSGLTLATVIGVPLGVLLEGSIGYQGLFWTVAVLGVLASIALLARPPVPAPPVMRIRERVSVLRNRAVLWVLVVSMLASSALYLGMGFGGLTGGAVGAGWPWGRCRPPSPSLPGSSSGGPTRPRPPLRSPPRQRLRLPPRRPNPSPEPAGQDP
ncbi:MFS transporter [Saccharopolyspora spinosa]|uniref:DHA1 family purine base/nucleoside efflux pump-like MFS transporter n=1 Tax=Saccharopolyspora spinosa TaxID=60894 RepID=A0A2N3XSL7_SACSN|nr:MFS transporter [Saccharopolyspora spinosa]PKW13686.1 DHA1 family purine base/nucleoside efflux pump-like MFS transporter [Saccharopolyspora spinosa]